MKGKDVVTAGLFGLGAGMGMAGLMYLIIQREVAPPMTVAVGERSATAKAEATETTSELEGF